MHQLADRTVSSPRHLQTVLTILVRGSPSPLSAHHASGSRSETSSPDAAAARVDRVVFRADARRAAGVDANPSGSPRQWTHPTQPAARTRHPDRGQRSPARSVDQAPDMIPGALRPADHRIVIDTGYVRLLTRQTSRARDLVPHAWCGCGAANPAADWGRDSASIAAVAGKPTSANAVGR